MIICGRFETLQNLPSSTRAELLEKCSGLKELLAEQPAAAALVHAAAELGDRLTPHTAAEGREVARRQAEELQTALEGLVDGVTRAERELQARLSRWSGFEEASTQLLKWIMDMEKALPSE